MPDPTRQCITCGKPMNYLGRGELPAYDYMPGMVFDLFDCPRCEGVRSWQRVPASTDAIVTTPRPAFLQADMERMDAEILASVEAAP